MQLDIDDIFFFFLFKRKVMSDLILSSIQFLANRALLNYFWNSYKAG